jgi:hypothetical protein
MPTPQRARQRNGVLKHWTCFDCKLVILYVVAKPLSPYEWSAPRSHMCPHCLYTHQLKLVYVTGVWEPRIEVLPEKHKTPRYRKPRVTK